VEEEIASLAYDLASDMERETFDVRETSETLVRLIRMIVQDEMDRPTDCVGHAPDMDDVTDRLGFLVRGADGMIRTACSVCGRRGRRE
jgi:hypothetical protein